MPLIKTISPGQFIAGAFAMNRLDGQHRYRAHMEGRSLIVTLDGEPVKGIHFGATADNRSVSAYIDGEGFIGGWQYPHKAMPWSYLAECINFGILYAASDHLPKAYGRKRSGPAYRC